MCNYDEKIISREPDEHFNQAYIDDFFADKGQLRNNIIILNFDIEDPDGNTIEVTGKYVRRIC